jgi:N-acetylornithine carbamoyltransferase
MGHHLTIAHPVQYELDEELMSEIVAVAEREGGSVRVTNAVDESFDGVDVVYAKSWGSRYFYGDPDRDIAERAGYRKDWIVDEKKMVRTNDAIFMHCLPVRRNVIVTDGVLDSPSSVVIDQAENRLHAQKAVMKRLATDERG